MFQIFCVIICLGWNNTDDDENSQERRTLCHISGHQVFCLPSPTLFQCLCTTVHQVGLGCSASASAVPPTHETCSPGLWGVNQLCQSVPTWSPAVVGSGLLSPQPPWFSCGSAWPVHWTWCWIKPDWKWGCDPDVFSWALPSWPVWGAQCHLCPIQKCSWTTWSRMCHTVDGAQW